MTTRPAKQTAFARRITPAELLRDWFRRGKDYDIYAHHPDFPPTGPDGLYLVSQVADWFDRWHGRGKSDIGEDRSAEEEALRIARNGRGQNQASA